MAKIGILPWLPSWNRTSNQDVEHTILQFFIKHRGRSFTRLNVEYDTRLADIQHALDILVRKGKLLEIGPISGGIILYTLLYEPQENSHTPVAIR